MTRMHTLRNSSVCAVHTRRLLRKHRQDRRWGHDGRRSGEVILRSD